MDLEGNRCLVKVYKKKKIWHSKKWFRTGETDLQENIKGVFEAINC